MAAYEDMAQYYRQMIKSGELKRGQKLPTNDEMVELHDVSLATVSKAVKLLKKDGVVYTTHAGTFAGLRPEDPRLVESKLEQVSCGGRPRCKNVMEVDRNLDLQSVLPSTGWSFRRVVIGWEYYCPGCTAKMDLDK